MSRRPEPPPAYPRARRGVGGSAIPTVSGTDARVDTTRTRRSPTRPGGNRQAEQALPYRGASLQIFTFDVTAFRGRGPGLSQGWLFTPGRSLTVTGARNGPPEAKNGEKGLLLRFVLTPGSDGASLSAAILAQAVPIPGASRRLRPSTRGQPQRPVVVILSQHGAPGSPGKSSLHSSIVHDRGFVDVVLRDVVLRAPIGAL